MDTCFQGTQQNWDRRKKRLLIAGMTGNKKVARHIIKAYPSIVCQSLGSGGETILHIAVELKSIDFVEMLLPYFTPIDLAIQNLKGNTPLCFAAANGCVQIAKLLVEKNGDLPMICGSHGIPLYLAAFLRHKDMVDYLLKKSNFAHLPREDREKIFLTSVTSLLFDALLEMINVDLNIILSRDDSGDTALHLLARLPNAFSTTNENNTWRNFSHSCISTKECSQQGKALKFMECILRFISNNGHLDCSRLMAEIPGLLLLAAQNGNTDFVIGVLRHSPNLITTVDDNHTSIFHLAVLNRHQDIFNLLHYVATGNSILSFADVDGNNLLHLAARIGPPSKLRLISGAALQLQCDMLWYKEVEKIVQPSYRHMKNHNGQTPRNIFNMQHEDLKERGRKWFFDTATSFMYVATLIATVTFTSAFTVPGAYDNQTGLPVLSGKVFFKVFLISEAIGMFSSSTSILMFLSIATSRYEVEDFLHTLPLMMMIGVAAMVISFCTTIFLCYHDGLGKNSIFLGLFSCVPSMFLLLTLPLVLDVLRSTYISRFLFRPCNCLFNVVLSEDYMDFQRGM